MKPDLKAMCNGAIQEKFENSFGRVMENMQDVNTPYKDEALVPNPVKLMPYRTFLEVDQPESAFIFRMRDDRGVSCAIFEADGGAWKIEAMQNIKAYLCDQLKDNPQFTIIA